MRVDAYTKAVLTIIAACPVWLCVVGAPITPVAAQRSEREPQEAVLAGSRVPLETLMALALAQMPPSAQNVAAEPFALDR